MITRTWKWLIILQIALKGLQQTYGNDDFPIIPQSFESTIEIKVRQGSSVILLSINEYVAEKSNQFKLKFKCNGHNMEFLYLLNTEEVLETFDKTCSVKHIKNSSFLQILKMPSIIEDSPPDFFIPSRTLMMQNQSAIFIGKETVRALNTNVWHKTFYWEAFSGTFNISYYFLDSLNSSIIPVRVIMEAVLENSGLLHHTYDYISFSSDTTDQFTFLTPPGVFCKRNETRPIPQIPDFFSYTEEITVALLRSVRRREVIYYKSAKLLRIDYQKRIPLSPSHYISTTYTVIKDYNTEIEYDMDDHNCTMVSIDVEYPSHPGNLSMMWEMKDKIVITAKPDQYFELDEFYVYVGMRPVRGMLGEVWISERSDFYIPKLGYFRKTIHEITLVSKEWQNSFSDPEYKFIPIRSVIIVYDNDNLDKIIFEIHFDIYSFSEENKNPSVFDISSCFPKPTERKYFEIEIPGHYSSIDEVNKQRFSQLVHKAIVKNAKISSLRVTQLSIDYNSTFIYASGLMIERPSALFEFIWLRNRNLPNINDKRIPNLPSLEDCALACLNETRFVCKSADYCGSYCFLSRSYDEKSTQESNSCHVLVRNDLDTKIDLTSFEAYQNLKRSIDYKYFSIAMKTPDGNHTSLYASSIRDGVFPGIRDFEYDSSIKVKFRIYQQEQKFSSRIISRSEKDVSLFSCLDLCQEEENFNCKSFNWCSRSSECFLSKKFMNEFEDADLEEDSRCSVFARIYTDDFEINNNFVLTDSYIKNKINNINDPEICAHLCKEENSFICRSFEFCPAKQLCFLMPSHLLDNEKPLTVANGECYHYSKLFLEDFKKSPKKELEGRNDIALNNLTENECAKACIDKLKTDCASYDYCAELNTICYISKSHATDFGVKVIDSHCDHFSRQYKEDGSPVSKNRNILPDSTPFSWGAVVGISILFLILGIIITLVIIQMRSRACSRKPNSSFKENMVFSNQNYVSKT